MCARRCTYTATDYTYRRSSVWIAIGIRSSISEDPTSRTAAFPLFRSPLPASESVRSVSRAEIFPEGSCDAAHAVVLLGERSDVEMRGGRTD